MDSMVATSRTQARVRPARDTASAGPVRSQATRVIHLLVLLIVLNQLIGSLFIERPLPGDPPGWIYTLHEYAGLTGVAVIGAFWVWMLLRRGETRLGRLLPWFSPARLRVLWADFSAQLRRLAHGRVPDDSDGALASAVHGLGLLTVTAMVVTGTMFFLTQGTPLGHDALALHKLVANLMWAYLFAHAGVAVLHHLLGSDIFSRMFWPVSSPAFWPGRRRRARRTAAHATQLRYSRR